MSRPTDISWKGLLNPAGIILFLCITLAIVGLLISSQELATKVDLDNIYLAPFKSSEYIFGTDALGRSVGFGLINGIKVSLSIAIVTALCSLLIGLLFSYLAGYLGNDKLHLSIPSICTWLVLSFLSFFYLWYSSSLLFLGAWIIIGLLIFFLDKKLFSHSRKVPIPLDRIIMKFVTLIKSLPGIFLILFVFALFSERSIFNVIALITFARIPSVVRLVRAEVLKVKNQEFIQSAEALGLSTFEIFRKHILPNIFTPLQTYLIYTMTTTILIESTLSFLGLGLSLETVSLGSMLSGSREYIGAWWLAIFPGGIIFLIIYSIKKIINQKTESEDYIYL